MAVASDTAALVAGARMGNQDAWAVLYRLAYPRLIAFAHRRLGNLEDARDAVSETMARAVASIERFDRDDAGFTPWLVGICRYVVADIQRAKYRFAREELRDCVSDAPGPVDHLMAGEERAHVRAAFARLDPDEQELLELRVVARLSSDEVAVVLGKKPSTVRMAQMRAMGRLRAFLGEASRGD